MSNPAEVSLRGLSNCGCCSGIRAETPATVENRPGLPAIAYRIGVHAQFKESMLAALSDSARPELRALRSRDDDDFSIALLDAAATMADVLSFYQERIANESYLRTATERRSVLEMARLIGYELRPGVAASTYLAFTLDETPGAPKQLSLDIGARVQSIPAPGEKPQTFETIEKIETRTEWNALKPRMTKVFIPQFGDTHVYLKGTATNLKPGDAILLVGPEREADAASERWDFRRVSTVTPDFDGNRTRVEWDKKLGAPAPSPVLPSANPKVYALRTRAGLFGYNAPQPANLSNDTLVHFGQNATSDWPYSLSGDSINLDTTYPGILPDSWIVLVRPDYTELYRVKSAIESAQTGFTLASKVTHCVLDTSANLSRFGGGNLRGTMVFAQSEFLDMAEQPITEAITGPTVLLAQNPVGLVKGQWLAASGKDSVTGEAISEIVAVSAISGSTITLNPPLVNTYKIDSFTFNANVARATHGESVQDVLGAGDASAAFQKFTLKQPPLTYISAANAAGAASTLEVRVNDQLWHEAPTLYGMGAKDHVFIARRDDAGNTSIEFGDGVTGARLPSGQMNVRAKYRKGIGLDGMLKAGQLSLLLSRPQGLKGVTNPIDASGAQDLEQLANARSNAPLTVLTLDRTVSLEDYEDFARAFAGVAKAMATWTWDGRVRRIFVTIAGPGGDHQIAPDSDTFRNLVAAIQKAGDPFVPIRVSSYQQALFKFGCNVKVDSDFETDKVLAAVEQALRSAFSFDARSFGQVVYLSEVIELVQSVQGVVAVDVTRLYRPDQTAPKVEQRLLAALPKPLPNGAVLPAELLTLHSGPLDALGVMA